jgi:hypothetical protein
MARRVYNFENPDRFVAGTVGQPGSRTFYLQARDGDRIVSVVLEKVQVALLAERLTQLLAEVRERGANVPEEPAPRPRHGAARRADQRGLPRRHDGHRLGRRGRVDRRRSPRHQRGRGSGRRDLEDEAEDDDDESDVVRVTSDPRKALAFAQRALEVVAAGGRRARSAASRSTPRATSAPAATASCTE